MAPPQKRALISLLFGIVRTVLLVALFIVRSGVETFTTDTSTRLLLSALFVGLLLTTAFAGVPWKACSSRGVDVDECAPAIILKRAPQVQLMAVILTMVACVIGTSPRRTGNSAACLSCGQCVSAQSPGVLTSYRRDQRV